MPRADRVVEAPYLTAEELRDLPSQTLAQLVIDLADNAQFQERINAFANGDTDDALAEQVYVYVNDQLTRERCALLARGYERDDIVVSRRLSVASGRYGPLAGAICGSRGAALRTDPRVTLELVLPDDDEEACAELLEDLRQLVTAAAAEIHEACAPYAGGLDA